MVTDKADIIITNKYDIALELTLTYSKSIWPLEWCLS